MKYLALIAFATAAAAVPLSSGDSYQKKAATEFFAGVYTCDSNAVSELAAEDVAISYPIFRQIFNKSAIRGKEAVEAFSQRFCSRWIDRFVEVHEAVEEGNTVVLVWSFSGVSNADVDGMPPKGERASWGGISVLKFDKDGKVFSEVGEESAPGPTARMSEGD